MVRRSDSHTAVPPSDGLKLETTPEHLVLRIKPRKHGWVPISRALIDDSRLQFDTRAIANWLLAKPDGWQIRLGVLPYLLQQRAGPGERMGRDRVRRMLRELENAGYLTRTRSQKPDGRWVWRIEFSDTPAPSTIDGSAVDGSTVAGSGVDISNTLNQSRVDKLIGTTTTSDVEATRSGAVVVPALQIQWPEILNGKYVEAASRLIEACPSEQRQAVLDEIAAMHTRGRVRSPLGLLKSLTDKAKRGEFSPNHSLSVDPKSSSKFQSDAHAGYLSTGTRTAANAPSPASEIARGILTGLREKGKTDRS
jgi:hypothetical protein